MRTWSDVILYCALHIRLHITLHAQVGEAGLPRAVVDLGDNIEFFFKCNVGLEPDTRPYKEAFL